MPGAISGATPTLAIAGARATVTLNRPDQHNRLEPADVEALRAITAELRERAEVRVAIFTAAGPTFSAGYHLGALAETGMASQATGSPTDLIAVIDQIETLPMPTIAAVNGSLYGGGLDLALACDFRIGVTPSRAFIPIARIGAQYPDASIHRLVTRAGAAAARRLLIAGETIDAAAMVASGILDDAVEPADLAGRIEVLAASIERQAPLSTRATKLVIADIARADYDAAAARASADALQRSADHQEGLAALREKRTPDFQGR